MHASRLFNLRQYFIYIVIAFQIQRKTGILQVRDCKKYLYIIPTCQPRHHLFQPRPRKTEFSPGPADILFSNHFSHPDLSFLLIYKSLFIRVNRSCFIFSFSALSHTLFPSVSISRYSLPRGTRTVFISCIGASSCSPVW